MTRDTGRLRLSELLGSISLATDLGTGQPMGHGLRTCLLAMDIATELGCDEDQLRSVYQVALLRFLGCTAETSALARDVGGDDLRFIANMAPVFHGKTTELMRTMIGSIAPDGSPIERGRLIAAALTDPDGEGRTLRAHCEVASMLARRLGLASSVVEALGHAYERWNGKGVPDGLAGDAIPFEIRVCTVARDVDLCNQAGVDEMGMLDDRRGKTYDPDVVDAYNAIRPDHPEADWDRLLAAEPEPVSYVDYIETVLEVMADFVDLKSPWTRGHSRRVSELAAVAAHEVGMGLEETGELRRAALVHDLGRVGIENGVWDKPGSLSLVEMEKVRLHPYLTERILSRCDSLRPLRELACRHHERVDGSGYHRQLDAGQLTEQDHILGAADVLAALLADRPHRPAFTLDRAAAVMADEVAAGALHGDAVACVVNAAGGDFDRPDRANPDGLTDRELEVLALISKEMTNKQMAEELHISPKTVGRHVENIYAKIGVSTRAGAAVYVMEHGLG